MAFDETTPLLEIAGVLRPPGSHVPLLFEPQVLMTIEGVLTDIVDLTDKAVQVDLGTSLQELTGDWVLSQTDYLEGKGTMPPTQILGQAAYDVRGIVGLKYQSSKQAVTAAGIVVFPQRLSPGPNYLKVHNNSTATLQGRLPRQR